MYSGHKEFHILHLHRIAKTSYASLLLGTFWAGYTFPEFKLLSNEHDVLESNFTRSQVPVSCLREHPQILEAASGFAGQRWAKTRASRQEEGVQEQELQAPADDQAEAGPVSNERI